jgi:hypothetical protein
MHLNQIGFSTNNRYPPCIQSFSSDTSFFRLFMFNQVKCNSIEQGEVLSSIFFSVYGIVLQKKKHPIGVYDKIPYQLTFL